MITKEKADKKNVIVAIMALAIGLLIGILATVILYKKKISSFQGGNIAFSESGKSRVPFNFPKMEIPDTITVISGKVDKIDGNNLLVISYPFGNEKKYTVKITNETRIVKRELKSNMKPPKQGEAPENPFNETDASLSDIKIGAMISADAGENVKNKTSFEAKTIYIDFMNIPPVPEKVNK